MVGTLTFIALFFSLACSLVFPVVLCIVFLRKQRPGFIPVLLGMGVFILFVLVLEALMHNLVLANPGISDFFGKNIWAYALYGGLAAGIFEETGRFLVFRFLMKKKTEWKHGVAYGIGHGGIEAILLVALSFVNLIVYAILINTGNFDAMTAALPKTTADALIAVKDSLVGDVWWTYALGGIERLCTMAIQIALSILVLYSVVQKKYLYFILAILLHAAIDIPAVFAQKGYIDTSLLEIVIVVIALAALCFILWSRKLFPVPENVPATVANPAQGSVIASDSEAAPGRPGDSANS